jgi:hypothetical protein
MPPSTSVTVEAKVGLIAEMSAAIAGAIAALFLLGIVVICVCRRWRKDESEERDSKRSIIQLEMINKDQAILGTHGSDEGIADEPLATQFPYAVGPPSYPSYAETTPSYGETSPLYARAMAPPPFYPGTFPDPVVGDQRP